MSFTEALTPCPGCKKQILLKEIRCPHCDAPADTTSTFLSFRRPDGTGGILDQQTAMYLRSPLPRPSQNDLRMLFDKTDRVQVMELVFKEKTGRFQSQITLSDLKDLKELQNALKIRDLPSGHLMTFGDVRLDFYSRGKLEAEIELVRCFVLRWRNVWRDDANLVDSRSVAEFLKSRGFPKLSDDIDQDEQNARESALRHEAWLRSWKQTIPNGLAPLVDRLCKERYSTDGETLTTALKLLAGESPSIEDQILSLLRWYGHGGGPWSGFPCDEVAPEVLPESYSAEQLLRTLENRGLDSQQLEGATRFIARWIPKEQKKHHRELVEKFRLSSSKQKLLGFILSTNDSAKIAALNKALEE